MALAGWLAWGDSIQESYRRKTSLEEDLDHDIVVAYMLRDSSRKESGEEQNPLIEPIREEFPAQNQEAYFQQPTLRDYCITNFSQDSEENLLARMIFGEARGCSQNERIAVGYTAVNRLQRPRRFGRNLHDVILRPWQYSCFNRNDPNRAQLMDPQQYDIRSFEECLEAARGILSQTYHDQTQGATHYFNPRLANPSWASRMIRIGSINNSEHVFYREES